MKMFVYGFDITIKYKEMIRFFFFLEKLIYNPELYPIEINSYTKQNKYYQNGQSIQAKQTTKKPSE